MDFLFFEWLQSRRLPTKDRHVSEGPAISLLSSRRDDSGESSHLSSVEAQAQDFTVSSETLACVPAVSYRLGICVTGHSTDKPSSQTK